MQTQEATVDEVVGMDATGRAWVNASGEQGECCLETQLEGD